MILLPAGRCSAAARTRFYSAPVPYHAARRGAPGSRSRAAAHAAGPRAAAERRAARVAPPPARAGRGAAPPDRRARVEAAIGGDRAPTREPEARERVTILLLHAWGMGGTIRTTLNLAARCPSTTTSRSSAWSAAARRRSSRSRPACRCRALDDRRGPPAASPGGAPARSRACSSTRTTTPTRWCSLWTDVQLAAAPAPLRGGRAHHHAPGVQPARRAARAPARDDVGQEHMNFHAHRPRLAADIRRALPAARRAHRAHGGRPRATTASCSPAPHARRADPQRAARRWTAASPSRRRQGGRGRRPAELAEGLRPADPARSRRVARATRTGSCASTAAGPERAALRALILEHELYGDAFLMGADAAARRRDGRGVAVRAHLALRGLRHGDRRGDEQGPAGRQLRLPARAGGDRQPGRRRPARRRTATSTASPPRCSS